MATGSRCITPLPPRPIGAIEGLPSSAFGLQARGKVALMAAASSRPGSGAPTLDPVLPGPADMNTVVAPKERQAERPSLSSSLYWWSSLRDAVTVLQCCVAFLGSEATETATELLIQCLAVPDSRRWLDNVPMPPVGR